MGNMEGYRRQAMLPVEGQILPAEFWTFETVQERLVAAMRLWKRSPGGGSWPFASDGPWHLVTIELYGPDVDKDAPLRPLPLTRAEVEERDQISEWLRHAPDRDRRLVILAVSQLASGRARIDWMGLRGPMGVKIGADGLRWRYNQAITAICCALNGVPMPKRKRTKRSFP